MKKTILLVIAMLLIGLAAANTMQSVSLTISNATAKTGQPEQVTYVVSGGKAPYSYYLILANASGSDVAAPVPQLNFYNKTSWIANFTIARSPLLSGPLTVRAFAYDNYGNQTNETVSLFVNYAATTSTVYTTTTAPSPIGPQDIPACSGFVLSTAGEQNVSGWCYWHGGDISDAWSHGNYEYIRASITGPGFGSTLDASYNSTSACAIGGKLDNGYANPGNYFMWLNVSGSVINGSCSPAYIKFTGYNPVESSSTTAPPVTSCNGIVLSTTLAQNVSTACYWAGGDLWLNDSAGSYTHVSGIIVGYNGSNLIFNEKPINVYGSAQGGSCSSTTGPVDLPAGSYTLYLNVSGSQARTSCPEAYLELYAPQTASTAASTSSTGTTTKTSAVSTEPTSVTTSVSTAASSSSTTVVAASVNTTTTAQPEQQPNPLQTLLNQLTSLFSSILKEL